MLNAFFKKNIDRELQVNAFSIALSNKANELATNELASVHFKNKSPVSRIQYAHRISHRHRGGGRGSFTNLNKTTTKKLFVSDRLMLAIYYT